MDYGSDEFHSRLAQEAFQGWLRWNEECFDRPLFHRTGFLLLSRRPFDEGGFEADSFASLSGRGVPVERLPPEELRRRFPVWSSEVYSDSYLSLDAGWVESGEVVRSLAAHALTLGIEFVQGRASRVLDRSGRVTGISLADGSEREADAVVVAAGAWTGRVVPELSDLMRPNAMPVVLFAPDDPHPFEAARFPPWGADIAGTGWYGFPVGRDGIVKIGHHGIGRRGEPDEPGSIPDGWEERVRAFLRESIPQLATAALAGERICFYCDTPDGAFWISRHHSIEGLAIASGGSGHGFKFAPVLGPLVADAVEGRAEPSLAPFAWRPGVATSKEDARYSGA
jgi:glycine/D-amino acid oxidase-like deaminating enzyme